LGLPDKRKVALSREEKADDSKEQSGDVLATSQGAHDLRGDSRSSELEEDNKAIVVQGARKTLTNRFKEGIRGQPRRSKDGRCSTHMREVEKHRKKLRTESGR